MIIKEFAKLCDCNPQTLRYYDSIDLLKPVKVDPYTGYRYYSAEQALDYLKIKKLQDAFFSIEEIKELLNATDDMIYDALNKKIMEQQAKLNEITKIQKSYQKEMKEMKDKILKFKEKLMTSSMELDYKDEFGISKDEYYEIIKSSNELIDNSMNEGMDYDDTQDEIEFVVTDDLEIIYELIGFNKIKDVLKKIPSITKGDYVIRICLNEKYKDNLAYTNVVIALILEKTISEEVRLEFSFEYEENIQSFRIYKKNK